MNKPWKLILLLTGIFLAGGVSGVFLTVRFGRNWVSQRTAPEQWAPMHLRKLAHRLELKPEQIEQLRPIIRRNMEEFGRLRSQSMAGNRAVMERMEREIAEKLTPGQRVKFDEYNRQMRERMRKLMQKKPAGGPRPEGERGGGPRPQDEPPPPPPAGAKPREPGA